MRRHYWMYGSGSWKEIFTVFCVLIVALVVAILCAIYSRELVHCPHCEKLIHYTLSDCEYCGAHLVLEVE